MEAPTGLFLETHAGVGGFSDPRITGYCSVTAWMRTRSVTPNQICNHGSTLFLKHGPLRKYSCKIIMFHLEKYGPRACIYVHEPYFELLLRVHHYRQQLTKILQHHVVVTINSGPYFYDLMTLQTINAHNFCMLTC